MANNNARRARCTHTTDARGNLVRTVHRCTVYLRNGVVHASASYRHCTVPSATPAHVRTVGWRKLNDDWNA